MTHLLAVPFTGLGLFRGYRGDTWLKNRIAIFKQFVLPSLLAQTEQNFWLWLQFRPEEETNPIVQDFITTLSSIRGLRVIVTYHGIVMWDDKYPDSVAEQRLRNSIKRSIPELAPIIEGDVLVTIQPSDDFYFSTAVAELHAWFAEHDGAAGWQRGYIMRYDTLELAEYNPTTNPPFFTIKYPNRIFLDPSLNFTFAPYKSHEYIGDHVGYHVLPGRGFVVGTHGENTSTTFVHPFKGEAVSPDILRALAYLASLQSAPASQSFS